MIRIGWMLVGFFVGLVLTIVLTCIAIDASDRRDDDDRKSSL